MTLARDVMPARAQVGRVWSAADVLALAQEQVASGRSVTAAPMGTGFTPLDDHLGGGLRPGELALLGGAQGLGKTMLALQMARNMVAAGGHATFVCYEHDVEQLLERLIALESGEVGGREAPGLDAVRGSLSAVPDGTGLYERLGVHGQSAMAAIASYGDRLQLVRASGSRTGSRELYEIASTATGLLVVDYLQKVHAGGRGVDEDERVTHVVEALKDLALDLGRPVLAVVASDKSGLSGRTRLRDLRGSTALAYEADVALMLNDKYDVVARNHLMYGGSEVERFHDWVVCSIEKNRNGVAGGDLEFEKDFGHGRFEPDGRVVLEMLANERLGLD